MKATNPWITYRTRFLVKAQQLTTTLDFTDILGRQHSGREGDYLVESSDAILRVVPRQIFEDIYVPVLSGQDETSARPNTAPQYETLLLEQPRNSAKSCRSAGAPSARDSAILSLPPHLTPHISPTLPRPPQPHPRPSLTVSLTCPSQRLLADHWPLITGRRLLCERPMNSTCGKQILAPAPSPSLLRIQPMVFLS